MRLRLAALLLALLVSASSVSPCTAAAIAHADRAAPEHATADAHATGSCHGPSSAIRARCRCGCAGEGPRSATNPFSAPWALPAPALASALPGKAPETAAPGGRPTSRAASGVEHVPIAL